MHNALDSGWTFIRSLGFDGNIVFLGSSGLTPQCYMVRVMMA